MVRADVASTLDEVFEQHGALRKRSRSWKLLIDPVSTSPLIFREPARERGDPAGWGCCWICRSVRRRRNFTGAAKRRDGCEVPNPILCWGNLIGPGDPTISLRVPTLAAACIPRILTTQTIADSAASSPAAVVACTGEESENCRIFSAEDP